MSEPLPVKASTDDPALSPAETRSLVDRHHRLTRVRTFLVSLYGVFALIPATVALTLAATREDPESELLYLGGLVWAVLWALLIAVYVRRRRAAIHAEARGARLADWPRGAGDRVRAALGALAVIGFGVLMVQTSYGAERVVNARPLAELHQRTTLTVESCRAGSWIPGIWWDCTVLIGSVRSDKSGLFTPADVGHKVEVAHGYYTRYRRVDAEEGEYARAAGRIAAGGGGIVIAFGVIRLFSRPFRRAWDRSPVSIRGDEIADVRGVPPVAAPEVEPVAVSAHPDLPPDVPEDAVPLSDHRLDTMPTGGKSVPKNTPAKLAGMYVLSTLLIVGIVVMALRVAPEDRPLAAVMAPLGGWLFAVSFMRLHRNEQDRDLAYRLHGTWIYAIGAEGVRRMDLHDPGVRLVRSKQPHRRLALCLPFPDRPDAVLLPLVGTERRPDRDLKALAVVLARSPHAEHQRIATQLGSLTTSPEAEPPVIPLLPLRREASSSTRSVSPWRPVLTVAFLLAAAADVAGTLYAAAAVDPSWWATGLVVLPGALLLGPLLRWTWFAALGLLGPGRGTAGFPEGTRPS